MKLLSLILAAGLLPVSALADTTPSSPAESAPASAATQAEPAANQQPAQTTNMAPAKQDMAEQSGFSKGSVVRSVFTSEVKDHEPTDKLQAAEDTKVYYFTELRDMNGQTATHRWEHDGKVMAEVKFNVGGNRWRVWSSKTFMPQAAGEWKVSVLNGAGEVISEANLQVSAAADANKAAAPASSEAAPAVDSPTVQPAPAAGTTQ